MAMARTWLERTDAEAEQPAEQPTLRCTLAAPLLPACAQWQVLPYRKPALGWLPGGSEQPPIQCGQAGSGASAAAVVHLLSPRLNTITRMMPPTFSATSAVAPPYVETQHDCAMFPASLSPGNACSTPTLPPPPVPNHPYPPPHCRRL